MRKTIDQVQRNNMGLYGTEEICRLIGISRGVIVNHREKGRIPYPSQRLGGLMYYTADQLATIRAFFAGRKKWQHGGNSEIASRPIKSALNGGGENCGISPKAN